MRAFQKLRISLPEIGEEKIKLHLEYYALIQICFETIC